MDQSRSPQAESVVQATLPWPGAFGIYKDSKIAVKRNLKTNVVIAILFGITSAISNIEADMSSTGLIIAVVVASILSLVFGVALAASTITSSRNQDFSLKQALRRGFSFTTVEYLVQAILIALILFVSLLLLVVPFFFVLPRLVLSPYFLVDRNMGPYQSIKASWAASRGHSLKAWGILGVTALFGVACFILIGFYLLVMYIAAYALLYLYVSKEEAVITDTGSNVNEGPISYSKPI